MFDCFVHIMFINVSTFQVFFSQNML